MNREKSRVFLSYARVDKCWAQLLETRLAQRGFEILTDLAVPPGESFIVQLDQAIRGCDVMVAILSTAYFRSSWCQYETAAAAASRVPIIPVLVEPCEVKGILRYYNRADLTSDTEKGLRDVIEAAEQLPALSPA